MITPADMTATPSVPYLNVMKMGKLLTEGDGCVQLQRPKKCPGATND